MEHQLELMETKFAQEIHEIEEVIDHIYVEKAASVRKNGQT